MVRYYRYTESFLRPFRSIEQFGVYRIALKYFQGWVLWVFGWIGCPDCPEVLYFTK